MEHCDHCGLLIEKWGNSWLHTNGMQTCFYATDFNHPRRTDCAEPVKEILIPHGKGE